MKEIILTIKNKQQSVARTFYILMLVAALLMIAPFIEGNPLTGAWALAFAGFFLTIMFFVTAGIFRNRAKKMDRLKSGEKLLVHLQLTDEMQKQFAKTMPTKNKEKNNAVMWVVGILFAIIGVLFIVFIEAENRAGFTVIFASVFLIVFAASKFFPDYYYRKNLNGDKQILIGEKYAYFNGYFHNWDYPLSGLSKVKAISKPFNGIYLAYYYTDRTWKHTHEIKFPVPKNFDPKPIVERLRSANKK